MRKLIIVSLILFTVAIVLPELRPLLLVGAFCATGGFMVGSQRKVASDSELDSTRAARLATPANSHALGEV